jgi:hypothetical protein
MVFGGWIIAAVSTIVITFWLIIGHNPLRFTENGAPSAVRYLPHSREPKCLPVATTGAWRRHCAARLAWPLPGNAAVAADII